MRLEYRHYILSQGMFLHCKNNLLNFVFNVSVTFLVSAHEVVGIHILYDAG